MFSDDFLLGNGVNIQKKKFQLFLKEGLIEELHNHFPFSFSYEQHSFVFSIDAENYIIKKPKWSPHQALENGTSYKVEVYVPSYWLLNNIPLTSPQFLFLGEIPMMTEEGNFIINGSPRTVIGQLTRSPGIYYKVRLGKNNQRRHLISFLSEKGGWFRIWSDQWGRIWARINKYRKMPILPFLRALGITDSCVLQIFGNPHFLWKSHYYFLNKYFFTNPLQKAILFVYIDLHRKYSRSPNFLYACEFFFNTFFQPQRYSFGQAGRFFLDQKLGREPQETQSLKPEDVLDALEKLSQLESGIIWIDNIDDLRNRRVKFVNELFQIEFNRGLEELKQNLKKRFHFFHHSKKSQSIQNKFPKKTFSSFQNFSKGKKKIQIKSFSLVKKKKLSKSLVGFSLFNSVLFTKKNKINIQKDIRIKKNFYFLVNKFSCLQNEKKSKEKVSSRIFSKHSSLNLPSFGSYIVPPLILFSSSFEKKEKFNRLFFQKKNLQRLLKPGFITQTFHKFFSLHPLSQLLDQSNPLSSAAHRRRLTSLGPGGVTRDAGLAVRDIHPSHYGRLCPIETPEGKNAGLVHALAMYADFDVNGQLQTPFLYTTHSNFSFLKTLVSNSFLLDKKQKKNLKWEDTNSLQQLEVTIPRCEIQLFRFQKEKKNFHPVEVCRFFSAMEEFYFTKGKPLFFSPTRAPLRLNLKNNLFSNFSEKKAIDILNWQSSLTKIKQYEDIQSSKVRTFSPVQILSLATSLIPFLEHDDANRALMGSNMQRQAVSLIFREKAIVGTGFEKVANQGVVAKRSGIVYKISSTQVLIRSHYGLDIYPLHSFSRSNQATCLQEGTFIKEGELILQGTSFADKESTYGGELAVGRNLLVGYMPWEGYNFEDAVVINTRLVEEDTYTSIHIERYSISLNKKFKEELSSEPPSTFPYERQNLDHDGIVIKGSFVDKESILVGKKKLLANEKLTPSFRLRAKVFQIKAPFYEDTSYRLMRGSGGRVLRIQLFFLSRPKIETPFRFLIKKFLEYPLRNQQWVFKLPKIQTSKPFSLIKKSKKFVLSSSSPSVSSFLKRNKRNFFFETSSFRSLKSSLEKLNPSVWIEKEKFDNFYNSFFLFEQVSKRFVKFPQKKVKPFLLKQPSREQVISTHNLSKSLQKIQIYIATRRRIRVGDKVAGRHGNKGIVSLILPRSSMPYLQDGTSLDMILNPLGVPSRMNLGQIFESLLGLAGKHLRQSYKIIPFDEFHSDRTQSPLDSKYLSDSKQISRALVYKKLFEAREKTGYKWLFDPNIPGKTYIFDGRSGEAFFQPVTVGVSYMLKLVHLVDDKMHTRSTGPYGLVTQQPLRGKAREGGQRIGEMEVWAFEGFGVSFILQELLTLKSDDLEGRAQVFMAIIDGTSLSAYQDEAFVTKLKLRSHTVLYKYSFSSKFLQPFVIGGNKFVLRRSFANENCRFFNLPIKIFFQTNKYQLQINHFIKFSSLKINLKKQIKKIIPKIKTLSKTKIGSQTGIEFLYTDYNLQLKAPIIFQNVPESFQLLVSELQSLCLDIISIKI